MAAMMPGAPPLRHLDLDLQSHIRSIPGFPKPGILFRDINTLLRSPEAMAEVIQQLGEFCDQVKPDLIVGIESRGIIFGAPLARDRRLGFVPVRKPGKLPGEVVALDYALEYGTDRLEIQADAFENSPRVLVVDDLLATGGTAAATGKLVEQAGGCLVGFAFVIELEGLGGRQALPAGNRLKRCCVTADCSASRRPLPTAANSTTRSSTARLGAGLVPVQPGVAPGPGRWDSIPNGAEGTAAARPSLGVVAGWT